MSCILFQSNLHDHLADFTFISREASGKTLTCYIASSDLHKIVNLHVFRERFLLGCVIFCISCADKRGSCYKWLYWHFNIIISFWFPCCLLFICLLSAFLVGCYALILKYWYFFTNILGERLLDPILDSMSRFRYLWNGQ